MICPYCQHEIAELWQPMWVTSDEKGLSLQEPRTTASLIVNEAEAVAAICRHAGIAQPKDLPFGVGLLLMARWMQCPNNNCGQLLVQVQRRVYDAHGKDRRALFGHVDNLVEEETLAFPKRQSARTVDPLVPDEFAVPFKEASLILDISPGMSAVLSRKLIGDLLERYASCSGYTVKEQIDKFIADSQHPSHIRENLHYLREMADFAAHTKKDLTTGEILQTTLEEASWTLDNVETLFDYFIVAPARDEKRRADMAAKMQKAGRKPIPPLQGGKP